MEVARGPLVYRGAKEICASVGVPWKRIAYYVERHGLPAFKIGDGGGWIALPEDLLKWLREQRALSLQRHNGRPGGGFAAHVSSG